MNLLTRAEAFGVFITSKCLLDEKTPKVFAECRGFPEDVARSCTRRKNDAYFLGLEA